MMFELAKEMSFEEKLYVNKLLEINHFLDYFNLNLERPRSYHGGVTQGKPSSETKGIQY